MIEHELKCWPEYFKPIKQGDKRFELRKNDRDFKVGDILRLREWDNKTGTYTGDFIRKRITYILPLIDFGIPTDYVIMSLSVHNVIN